MDADTNHPDWDDDLFHFFVSSAFGWGVADTMNGALRKAVVNSRTMHTPVEYHIWRIHGGKWDALFMEYEINFYEPQIESKVYLGQIELTGNELSPGE